MLALLCNATEVSPTLSQKLLNMVVCTELRDRSTLKSPPTTMPHCRGAVLGWGRGRGPPNVGKALKFYRIDLITDADVHTAHSSTDKNKRWGEASPPFFSPRTATRCYTDSKTFLVETATYKYLVRRRQPAANGRY